MFGEIAGALGGLVGSLFGSNKEADMAEKNIELQREFAQNGIRWKVKDAQKAGIHPLYALGAQTTAFSPVSVGSTDFATAGQNIGSAIGAMVTPKEKIGDFQKTVQQLTLQKMGLENELLASSLRNVNQPGRGPGMPVGRMIPGQGNTPATAQEMTAGGGAVTIQVNPQNTPAQVVSDQYGDATSEVVGGMNAIDDMMKTQGTPYPHEVPQRIYDWMKRNGYVQSRDYTRRVGPRP